MTNFHNDPGMPRSKAQMSGRKLMKGAAVIGLEYDGTAPQKFVAVAGALEIRQGESHWFVANNARLTDGKFIDAGNWFTGRNAMKKAAAKAAKLTAMKARLFAGAN